MKPQTWCKVWWSTGEETTAGLVIDADRVRRLSLVELSRLWPHSEFAKMQTLHVGPSYTSWEDAFNTPKTTGSASARRGKRYSK